MRVGLFCKTCAQDFEWFRLAFASFRKFWRYENTRWLVVLDRDCQLLVDRSLTEGGARLVFVDPWPDRYAHAMAMKACADIFMRDCDVVMLYDSDMMLTRPTELGELMPYPELRPTIYYENWNDKPSSLMARRVWAPASMRSTGRLLDRDYMVAPVWLYWASTFRLARHLVEEHTKMPFLQAVYSPHLYDWHKFQDHPMTFCDMENLAMAALILERQLYSFTPIDQCGELPIKQFWSHSDLNEARPTLEKILAGS